VSTIYRHSGRTDPDGELVDQSSLTNGQRPWVMREVRRAGLLAVVLVLAASACGVAIDNQDLIMSDTDTGSTTPNPISTAGATSDFSIFVVSGVTVRVQTVLGEIPDRATTVAITPDTIIDSGDGPHACLLVTLTSRPPQCSGPALIGFDIGTLPGVVESEGVRWASTRGLRFVGTWDGADLMRIQPPETIVELPNSEINLPPPERDHTKEQLAAIQKELQTYPGDGHGHIALVENGWVVVTVGVVDASIASSLAAAVVDPSVIYLIGGAEILE